MGVAGRQRDESAMACKIVMIASCAPSPLKPLMICWSPASGTRNAASIPGSRRLLLRLVVGIKKAGAEDQKARI